MHGTRLWVVETIMAIMQADRECAVIATEIFGCVLRQIMVVAVAVIVVGIMFTVTLAMLRIRKIATGLRAVVAVQRFAVFQQILRCRQKQPTLRRILCAVAVVMAVDIIDVMAGITAVVKCK